MIDGGQTAEAPAFFVDHSTSMIPPIWIDDDLRIVMQGAVVGSMSDATDARISRRQALEIVMRDDKMLAIKSPLGVCMDREDSGESAVLPSRYEHASFQWIAQTAVEIVTCPLLYQRIEVARRRNDEWRSDREFEAEQFRLINQKENGHGK